MSWITDNKGQGTWDFDVPVREEEETEPTIFPMALTIVNPGAEEGDATGWTADLRTSPGIKSTNKRTGNYSFVVSVGNSWAAFRQDVLIDVEAIPYIDEGLVKAKASVWQNGWSGDDDAGRFVIEVYSSTSVFDATTFLARWQYDFSHMTTWVLRTIDEYLPVGSRAIRIQVEGYREDGTELSSYWDDFSDIELSIPGKKRVDIGLVNPGINASDMTGWDYDHAGRTTSTNTAIILPCGAFFYGGGSNAASYIEQVVNLSSTIRAPIRVYGQEVYDSGVNGEHNRVLFHLDAIAGSWENKDKLKTTITFLDSADASLGTIEGTNKAWSPHWASHKLSVVPPKETRKIKIRFDFTRFSGVNNNGAITAINAYIVFLPVENIVGNWEDDQNLGSWPFIEQPDKWGYLNNPRWSNGKKAAADSMSASEFCEGIGLSLDPDTHKPCGHWHKLAGSRTGTIETISPIGHWIAALSEIDDPYIYLYDTTLCAVIKIDTTNDPPEVVDTLIINDATYTLDCGWQNYGSQRGGYCISTSCDKLWYLFRNTSNGDARLVEVDISGSYMSIIKTSEHSGALAGRKITDACGDDDYAFFSTDLVSGMILRFDTDHSILDKRFNYAATGALDESIHSITINSSINEICWLYARAVPFMTCKCPYSDYDFNVRWTFSETDDGLDSAKDQNWLRYDGRIPSIFRQRVHWAPNGVAYYYSSWDQNIGRAYVQNLQWMQSYMGGDLSYFYILIKNNANSIRLLHRFTHRSSILGGALTEISVDTSAYTSRFGTHFSTSVYNALSNKSFLVAYDSANRTNYITSYDQGLNVISDTPYYSTTKIVVTEYEDLALNEPQVWPM